MSCQLEIYAFSDSDLAGDTRDRIPTSGYVFMMAVGAVSLCSSEQSLLISSKYEVKYISSTAVCNKAIWLHCLLIGIVSSCKNGITIFSDLHSEIKIAWSERINFSTSILM